jgi:peptidoglycan-N-acetylglucosamine deacetylase
VLGHHRSLSGRCTTLELDVPPFVAPCLIYTMALVKTPSFIPSLLPNYQWHIDTQVREIFLTFDDGPTPYVTEWVLDVLAQFDAKATFFEIGRNILKYPKVALEVLNRGHIIGNHTFSHMNGWVNNQKDYLYEVELTDNIMESTLGLRPKYFRPPYGRLNFQAARKILEHHQIIMWDVLSRDFDPTISAEQCLANVLDHFHIGSTIVMHDSFKCEEKLKKVLPAMLSYFQQESIQVSAIRC